MQPALERKTLTIPEVARLLGVARNVAYRLAAEEGELVGVPVLRVGRRLVVPSAPFRKALGLDVDPGTDGT